MRGGPLALITIYKCVALSTVVKFVDLVKMEEILENSGFQLILFKIMQHFSIEDILKCRKVNSKWKMFIDTNKIMLQKLIEPRLCYLCAIQNTFKMCNKVDQTKIDGKIEFLRKTVHSGNVEELQKIAFSKKEDIKLQIVLKDNLIMCKIRVKDDQKIFKKIIYLLLKLRIKYVKNYYESRLSTWKKGSVIKS